MEARREVRACHFCRGTGVERFRKRGIAIVDCTNCGHRYADYEPATDHTRVVYDDAYFGGGSGEYAGYERELAILERKGAWYARVLSRYTEPGTLLEVGCASGAMLDGYRKHRWTVSGIEPNAKMAADARSRGLDVRTGALEDLELGGPYRAMTFVQVLPHLYDVRRALERAAEATAPGGLWLIETWNRNSVVARLLGKRWHEYNPPSVLHWFSRESLPKLLAPLGFGRIAKGRPPKSIVGAHAKSLLNRPGETGLAAAAARLAARAIPANLEVPYPADDITWQLYRKL